MTKKAVTYLVVIFLAFALLLHYPFLAIMNKATLLLGIPAFFIYLLVIWISLVLLSYWIVKKNKVEDDHGN